MLSHLALKNFKSWKTADLQFGKITGLFGTNSSGKSSLLQFLLLMKQTTVASDRSVALDLNGALTSLGSMRDVLFNHDVERMLEFKLGFQLPEKLKIENPSGRRADILTQSEDLELESKISSNDSVPQANMLSYRLGDDSFRLVKKKGPGLNYSLTSTMENFEFSRTKGRPWELSGPRKAYQFPDQARTYFQNSGFLADLEFEFERSMGKVYYLGPLRKHPQRDYLWARSVPPDVGAQGERVIDAILSSQERGEKRNLGHGRKLMEFSAMISHWLREMGLVYEFRVAEIARGSNRWQAWIKTSKGSSEVLLTDVGFGVSQVLPVITLLYYVDEGSTVVLEQPEIHLHPLAQAELADVIINAAFYRNVQVVVESHSEHFLLRLQRRIAEERIPAEDVKLYFCDSGRGHSTIESLRLDDLGNIGNWPHKFMGDAFTETAVAEVARIHRRMNAA